MEEEIEDTKKEIKVTEEELKVMEIRLLEEKKAQENIKRVTEEINTILGINNMMLDAVMVISNKGATPQIRILYK